MKQFIKERPLYVPLFAAFPVLSIFSSNLALLSLSDLWRPLFFVVAGSVLIWGLCSLLWRSASRGAVSTLVLEAGILGYRPFCDHWHDALIGPADNYWAFLTLLLAVLAGWKLWKADYALNVLGTFLVVFSVGTILAKYAAIVAHRPKVAPAVAGSFSGGRAPDIVYVILDGYARGDDLQRVMGLDNSEFLNGLRERGFFVADASHSNYVQTELSLASSLNMDLIQNLLPKISPGEEDRSPLDHLVDDNRVAQFLKSRGYTTITITSGFPAFHFTQSDLHLERSNSSTLFESFLLGMTPFGTGSRYLESQFDTRRRILLTAINNLASMADPNPQPRFIFAHILAPHPPFVFNADESPAKPRSGITFGFEDGSDFLMSGGSKSEYRDGYRNQIQALNKLVMPAIDALLNRTGPKPIIVIQGDHGSKLNLDQNSLAKTDVNESFPNLAAIYAPDSIRDKLYSRLYSGLTPVNEFRILLSTLFGAQLPNLPDQSWYSGFDHPYRFTEVTNRIKAPN